jgi:hypothetical protein
VSRVAVVMCCVWVCAALCTLPQAQGLPSSLPSLLVVRTLLPFFGAVVHSLCCVLSWGFVYATTSPATSV